MAPRVVRRWIIRVGALGLLLTAAPGCLGIGHHAPPRPVSVPAELPRELSKVMHPTYRIEPPDILQIDLVAAVPNEQLRIKPYDTIGITGENTLPPPAAPIAGAYTVGEGGSVDLGSPYGTVKVTNLTLAEAKAAIEKFLTKDLKEPRVSVSLVQTRAAQQVRGPHLVRADGTVSLGTYGAVPVVGLTLAEARAAIEEHLRSHFQNPEIALDIVGYNSKVYYVVFDFGGSGQQVTRVPITGNETVLDGIGQLNGLPTVSDPSRIVLTRPGPVGCAPQVMPVNWQAIVEFGDTRTNYQILPGDRIHVRAYPLVETDTKLARVIAPIERLLGVTLLGSSTVNSIRTDPNLNGNNNFNR